VTPSGPSHRRPLGLRPLLAAGVIDSIGLAFGWTVFLLVITKRGGLDEGALMAAAMLAGVALSAPFSAWRSPRLSPRTLLRRLAVAEGLCRAGLFVLLWIDPGALLLVPVIVVMNMLAWTAFAAMRSEVARAEEAAGHGRSLTHYTIAVAASEALAAGAASLLLRQTPPTAVLVAVACVYGLSLTPQWWVGTRAEPDGRPRSAQPPGVRVVQAVLLPCGLGTVVFLLASGPALLATVLAFERYGATGVLVSAVAFAAGSLGAARLQAVLGRWRPTAPSTFLVGALLVGGWALSDGNLIGLALAQACAGLAQCALEGHLDSRVVARLEARGGLGTEAGLEAGAVTTGLAFASSSRALGGALAVVLLPVLLDLTTLPLICATTATVLLLAALVAGAISVGRVTASFTVGFVVGLPLRTLSHLRPGRPTVDPDQANDRPAGSTDVVSPTSLVSPTSVVSPNSPVSSSADRAMFLDPAREPGAVHRERRAHPARR
jgi:hypothetical protein